MKAIIVIFILLFCCVGQAVDTSDPIRPVVRLNSGTVRGRQVSVPGGRDADMFLGIPYADPPVGELRFAAPRAFSNPWNGERDCTREPAMCPRGLCRPIKLTSQAVVENGTQKEDCLTLDVYRPAGTGPDHRLPVMVWIHGGGYHRGNANMYPGSAITSHNDVIVVVMNYRLGLLGFLNIPGTELTGNYGMLDQVQALKWVQDNIARFGGNPGHVTIFGESAGGSSVGLHILSPLSQGLFRYAILQSGAATAPFAAFTIGEDDTTRYDSFLDRLDCETGKDLVACLRDRTTEEFIKAQGTCDMLTLGLEFPVPRVDGHFLPDEPRVLLAEGRFNKPDAVIVGLTHDEGPYLSHITNEMPTLESLKKLVQGVFYTQNGETDIVKDVILKQYSTGDLTREEVMRRGGDLLHDSWFLAPAVYSAKSFVQAGIPTYFYQLSYSAKFAMNPAWVGCTHADDLQYVFGMPFSLNSPIIKVTSYTDDDKKTSSTIMKLWTSFATNGVPHCVGCVTWPRYSTEHGEYLDIGLVQRVERKLHGEYLDIGLVQRVERKLHEERVAFWEEKVESLKNKASRERTEL